MAEIKNSIYRTIHILSLLFAILMVTLGLIVDFNSVWYMNAWEKILIYVTPMIVLFYDMNLQLKYLEDKEQKKKLQRKTFKRIFYIYIIALATVLFLGSAFRRSFSDRNIWEVVPFSTDHLKYYCNLIPFKSVNMYYHAFQKHSMSLTIIIVNVLGNLFAFAPFGLFIPALYRKKIKNVFRFTLVVTLACVLAEGIQFITMVGQADIDDVILNVSGALVCYVLYHIPMVRNLMFRLFPYMISSK